MAPMRRGSFNFQQQIRAAHISLQMTALSVAHAVRQLGATKPDPPDHARIQCNACHVIEP
jgi:hypothetical protein